VRYEPVVPDKVVVTDEAVAVLLSHTTGVYFHTLFARKSDRLDLYMLGESSVVGSAEAVSMGQQIVGTIWISPDVSEIPGNKLYVLGKSGGQFIDLGSVTEQAFYEVKKISDTRFQLYRSEDGRKVWKQDYDFPIADEVSSLPVGN